MAGAVASAETASRPIVAFLGPTLSVGEARRFLDAVYLPPAAQGSIVLAVKEFQPKAILLIDGIFQSEPAVRHKEILWALSRGIHVVGAASMGALRAAELYRYGMIGVGLIYRWYRRFHFAPDDAVAVLHGPGSVGWAALTCARIDLRRTLRAAERHALIASPLRQRLDAATASIPYRDLTLRRAVAEACDCEMNELPAEDLVRTLERAFVQQKKLDALAALHHLRSANLADHPHKPEFVSTSAFVRDCEFVGIDAASLEVASGR